MMSILPEAPINFMSLYTTYCISVDKIDELKNDIDKYIKNAKLTADNKLSAIEIYNIRTKFQISLFSHKNQILVEFNRKSGCSLEYGNIYRKMVEHLTNKLHIQPFIKN